MGKPDTKLLDFIAQNPLLIWSIIHDNSRNIILSAFKNAPNPKTKDHGTDIGYWWKDKE